MSDLTSPNGPVLAELLARTIAQHRDTDPFGKVTVIAPNIYSALILRRAVVRIAVRDGTGLFNVAFDRIEDVADAILRADPDTPEVQPMSRLVASEIVHDALDTIVSDAGFGLAANKRRFVDAIRATLQELEQLPEGAEAALERLSARTKSPIHRQLRQIYAYYRKRAGGMVTRAEIAKTAAAVAQHKPELVREVAGRKLLLLTPPSDFGPNAVFSDTLAANPGAERIHLVAETESDAAADPDADAASERVARRFYATPSPVEAPRLLLRNVFKQLRRGIGMGEIAVLVPDSAAKSRIRAAFKFAGIDLAGNDSHGLASDPAGRFVLLLLDVVATGLRRDAFQRWLSFGAIASPADGAPVPTDRWSHIARSAMIASVAADSDWLRRIEIYRNGIEYRIRRLEADPDFDAGGDNIGVDGTRPVVLSVDQLRVQLAEIDRLCKFIEVLQSDLARVLPARIRSDDVTGRDDVDDERHHGASSWFERAAWVREMFGKYVDQSVKPLADLKGYQYISNILDQIAGLDRFNPTGADSESGAGEFGRLEPEDESSEFSAEGFARLEPEPASDAPEDDDAVSFERFSQTLRGAVNAVPAPRSNIGRGVLVTDDIDAAIANAFRAIHVMELTDNAFQISGADHPMIRDRDRSTLDAHGAILPLVAAQQRARRNRLALAAQSAPDRSFYWPRTTAGSSTESFPSPLFADSLSRLRGDIVRPEEITAGNVAEVEEAPTLAEAMTDLRNTWEPYALDMLRANTATGLFVGDTVTPEVDDGRLADATWGSHPRRQTSPEGAKILVHVSADRPVEHIPSSASRLELFMGCPYRYFLVEVVGVEALDPEPDVFGLSPLDRGTIIHDILDNYVTQCQGVEEPRLTSALFRESCRRAFFDHAKRAIPPPGPIWRLEQQRIMRQLEHWRRSEEKVLEGLDGYSETEVRFGYPGTPDVSIPVVTLDGVSVDFVLRGSIDRMAWSADESSLAVIDYKSGSSARYVGLNRDAIAKGSHLQIPVYAVAASIITRDKPTGSITGFYWFVTETDPKNAAMPRVPMRARDAHPRVETALRAIGTLIVDGHYPAMPGASAAYGGNRGWQNCNNCQFNDSCRSDRRGTWDDFAGIKDDPLGRPVAATFDRRQLFRQLLEPKEDSE